MTTRSADTQQRLLLAIHVYWREHGYSPSLRDLKAMCELSSTSVVKTHLAHLRAKGLIAYEDNVARTIRARGGAA